MSDQPRPTPRTDFIQEQVQEGKLCIGNVLDFARELEIESDAREERVRELENLLSDTEKVAAWTIGNLQAENDKLREALNPSYRYFLDKDGFRWKVPTNGACGFGLSVGSEEWQRCGLSLENVTLCHEFIRGESVETDENGVPLRKEEG